MLSARKAVEQMLEYHPPLAGRKGLRLDFNENAEGCSPRVLARIMEITADELARYPEREPVEAIAAAHLGLAADQVLLTNGRPAHWSNSSLSSRRKYSRTVSVSSWATWS